jgi:serine/threonine protein kinase
VFVAYFISHPPKTVSTPLGLRPPELIIGGKVDKTLDIWSFGCLVFKFITGYSLFPEGLGYDQEAAIDSLILPDNLYSLWTRSSKYYTPKRVQFNTLTCEPQEGMDPFSLKEVPLEKLFDQYKSPDFPDKEAERVTALLRRILQYDPAKRPTPSQILQDPWFTS